MRPDMDDEGPVPSDQKSVEAAHKAAKDKCLDIFEMTVTTLGNAWAAIIVDKKNVGHYLTGTIA